MNAKMSGDVPQRGGLGLELPAIPRRQDIKKLSGIFYTHCL